MKRILITLLSLLLAAGTASAQKDLKCWAVFHGDVVPSQWMVKTVARGGSIALYRLDYYLGLSFTAEEELVRKVAELVEADAAAATGTEMEKVGDLLTYALVQPPVKGKGHRYLCYQVRPAGDRWKVTLLYLEGPATLEDLRSMFDKQ